MWKGQKLALIFLQPKPSSSFTPSSSIANPHAEVAREMQEDDMDKQEQEEENFKTKSNEAVNEAPTVDIIDQYTQEEKEEAMVEDNVDLNLFINWLDHHMNLIVKITPKALNGSSSDGRSISPKTLAEAPSFEIPHIDFVLKDLLKIIKDCDLMV